MILKNGLPPVFNQTVTIYNKIETLSSGRTVTSWKRYIIHNVNSAIKRSQKEADRGTVNDNTYECYIAKNPYYYPADKFTAGTAGFTIRCGDLVILKAVNDEIADEQGKRISDIINKYRPGCFTIKTFSDNTGKLKLGEHYYISGV